MMVLLTACTQQQDTTSTSASPTSTPAVNSTAESPASTTASSPTSESPSDSATSSASSDKGEANLAEMIGTTQDGWIPKVLKSANFKEGMTPEEVGKTIPGAEKVSEYGFSEVTVADVPGLQKYEFYFAKDDAGKPTKLMSIRLHLDPSLNNPESYKKLVDVLVKKYGEAKPEDIEKQLITWVGPEFATIQLTKGTTNFEGYVLNVSVPKS